MKIYIASNECQKGKIDTAALQQWCAESGVAISSCARDADYIYIGTCAFTEFMENKSAALIAECVQKNRKARLIVGGCLPRINGRRISEIAHGAATTSPQNLQQDIARLLPAVRTSSVGSDCPLVQAPGFRESLAASLRRYWNEFGFSDACAQRIIALRDAIAACGHAREPRRSLPGRDPVFDSHRDWLRKSVQLLRGAFCARTAAQSSSAGDS